MAYDKQTWTAREGTNLKKYTKASETATTVILTNTPDSITVEGTPFSVDRMNHIEEGIESAHENIDALEIVDSRIYETALSQTSRNWVAIASNGADVFASVSTSTPGGGAGIYKQTGGTGNFVLYWSHDTALIQGLACVGADIYYSVYGGDIYKQTGGTGNFNALSQATRNWLGLCQYGNDVYACSSGDIYKQTNGTGDFVALGQASRYWSGIIRVGDDVYACVSGGDIYKQTNGTGDFVALGQASRDWRYLAVVGSDVYASVLAGQIYKQTSATGVFEAVTTSTLNWLGLATRENTLYGCVSVLSVGDIYTFRISSALEVYSTAETLTNQTFLGYPVYRKVINFGALPNNTAKSVAHNISGTWRLFRLMGEAYNPTTGIRIQMTYGGLPAHLYADNTNAIVLTSVNATAFTSSYITIEYIKAAL